jgi:hypothetical protein
MPLTFPHQHRLPTVLALRHSFPLQPPLRLELFAPQASSHRGVPVVLWVGAFHSPPRFDLLAQVMPDEFLQKLESCRRARFYLAGLGTFYAPSGPWAKEQLGSGSVGGVAS